MQKCPCAPAAVALAATKLCSIINFYIVIGLIKKIPKYVLCNVYNMCMYLLCLNLIILTNQNRLIAVNLIARLIAVNKICLIKKHFQITNKMKTSSKKLGTFEFTTKEYLVLSQIRCVEFNGKPEAPELH